MLKYFLLAVLSFGLLACAPKDAHYYSLHPKALQQAIEKCPNQHPEQVSCEQLKAVAISVNELALQLRADPQGFGKKIIALQTLIAKEGIALKKAPTPALQQSLSENKRQLQAYLAIVKWLESPEG